MAGHKTGGNKQGCRKEHVTEQRGWRSCTDRGGWVEDLHVELGSATVAPNGIRMIIRWIFTAEPCLFQASSSRRKPSVLWSVQSGCTPACGPCSPSWAGAATGRSPSELPAQWTGWATGSRWITPPSSRLCLCSALSCPIWSSSSLILASPGNCTGLTNPSRAAIFSTTTLRGELLL